MTFVERLIPATLTAGTRRRDELAFLPAALEIVETPPSPTGRAISASIAAVFCIALIWASIGRVDIIATATGKVVPRGRTKVIQPFETAVVRAIHVRDGQRVKAGDVLVELDPTVSEAELGHLEGDLLATEIEIARLRAALAGGDDPTSQFVPPDRAAPAQIAAAQRFLSSQIAEQSAKIASIEWQATQKKAERATAEATIAKIEALIPILQQRVDVRKYLVEKEFGSKLQFLGDMQELVGQQQDLLVQKSRHREVDAALGGLEETRLRTQAEYTRGLSDDLAKAEQKAAGLRQDVIKAGQRTSLLRLTAQEDGVVQQLAVHSIGGVVTPAQTLMVLVPSTSILEIEAMVSNHDIGFVVPGQQAAIKVDTFSFTRYGLRKGEVLNVSQDAITRDKPVDKNSDKNGGTEASSSEPKGQELVYSARVSLDSPQMQVDERLVNLAPGMAVTVEIKTGSRRIIDYLLSPLLRYSQESLRER
jgi:hemolysin D